MNLLQATQLGQKILQKRSSTPMLDAQVLLSFVIGKDSTYLLTYPEFKLSSKQKFWYLYALCKRWLRYPIAYITGSIEFYGIDFFINKHVLTPRQDTEVLVNTVLEYIHAQEKSLTALDIGTGSGCIPISILKNTSHISGFDAIDISKKALKVAQKNIDKHSLEENLTLIHSDLLESVTGKYDIMISNPPYVPYSDYTQETSIKREPTSAITDFGNGLAFYEKILQQIVKKDMLPQAIFFEIGADQGVAISQLIKKYAPQYTVRIIQDLASRDRVIEALLPSSVRDTMK
jgi:release factor glutamine methyltransferase